MLWLKGDSKWSTIKRVSCLNIDQFTISELLKIALQNHFIFVGEGCDNFLLIGNGICNSENNNQKCLYDGGDCCGYDCPDCQCFHEKICAIGG